MKTSFFIGLDVGGTKIAAGLVVSSGHLIARKKYPMPLHASSAAIIALIATGIRELLEENAIRPKQLRGIGAGIPGVVNAATGMIVSTPNIDLGGVNLVRELEKRFTVCAAIGNDVNLGLLGEQWRGAARGVQNVVGLFPGTGLGGAIIANGTLLTGAHGAAGEIGHLIMDPAGDRCGCGNRGCLETLVSRWALERDLRYALDHGKKSVLVKLVGRHPRRIKSKVLLQALKKKDPLVTAAFGTMTETLGTACISLLHLFDPERIVLGGGLIEACGDFIVPRVQKALHKDPFFSPFSRCEVVRSQLGDDAIMLGAVALLHQKLRLPLPGTDSASVIISLPGSVTIDGRTYTKDFYLRADGKVKKRKLKKTAPPREHMTIDLEEAKRLGKKSPRELIIARASRGITITAAARSFFQKEGIRVRNLPLAKGLAAFNGASAKKALVVMFPLARS